MPCLSSVLREEITDCSAECSGLNADVEHIQENPLSTDSTDEDMDMEHFLGLAEGYMIYKDNFATLRKFDPQNKSLGETFNEFLSLRLNTGIPILIYFCRLHCGSGAFVR